MHRPIFRRHQRKFSFHFLFQIQLTFDSLIDTVFWAAKYNESFILSVSRQEQQRKNQRKFLHIFFLHEIRKVIALEMQ